MYFIVYVHLLVYYRRILLKKCTEWWASRYFSPVQPLMPIVNIMLIYSQKCAQFSYLNYLTCNPLFAYNLCVHLWSNTILTITCLSLMALYLTTFKRYKYLFRKVATSILLSVRIVTKLLYFSKTFYPILFQNAVAAVAVMSLLKIRSVYRLNPYPTAFPYGNGMVLHFYQQQESSTTKTVHKVINKGLKTYV